MAALHRQSGLAQTQEFAVTGAVSGQTVAVSGASSQVGDFLLPRLLASGCEVIALGRHADKFQTQFNGLKIDLCAALPDGLRADALIHLAPLWLLPDRVPDFAARGVTRIVALGSTSVLTKTGSPDRAERAIAEQLSRAEAALAERCGRLSIAWTLLRPTLIYGAGRDANISAMAAFIRRFGFFPLAGAASGLRSPVHAEDVATVCIAALHADVARNRTYNIAGGENLTYHDMVLRVFGAMGVAPRLLAMPVSLMQALASVAALIGVPGINAELVRRMNRDQAFDHADAVRDLGYAPRPFQPEI
jgi:nucleoside-diphosphate-sugar epimerase